MGGYHSTSMSISHKDSPISPKRHGDVLHSPEKDEAHSGQKSLSRYLGTHDLLHEHHILYSNHESRQLHGIYGCKAHKSSGDLESSHRSPPPPLFLSFVISTNSIIPLLTLLNGLTILHDVQESAD